MQGSMDRWERLAPLSGAVFAVLLAILFFNTGDEPDADAKLSKVVDYWSKNDNKEMVNAIVGGLGVIFLVWFASVVRTMLLRADGGSGRLPTLALVGAAIAGTGGAFFSSLAFTAADTAGDISPEATQALSALNSDGFFILAVGVAIYMLATGISTLRDGGLPRYLGFAALVIGLAAVTPAGFFAFLAFILWNLVTSFVIFRSWSEQAAPAPTAP